MFSFIKKLDNLKKTIKDLKAVLQMERQERERFASRTVKDLDDLADRIRDLSNRIDNRTSMSGNDDVITRIHHSDILRRLLSEAGLKLVYHPTEYSRLSIEEKEQDAEQNSQTSG